MTALRACLAGLLALTGAACATATPPGEQQASPEAPQSKRGGVFQVPVAGTNAHLNPYAYGGAINQMSDTMYEKLVARDSRPGVNWAGDPSIKPWLAERWERTDENTYLFQLRTDVKWHDGQPFTSEDVLHSFNYLKETPGLTDTARVGNVKSVEALDGHRVHVA